MSTQVSLPASLLERRSTFWLVVALIAVLFALTNLPWTLDDYDQAKQAFTSYEMVNEGHWLFQHTPNERIATKPPLVGWISAGLYAATHSWDMAWRVPSIAAAFALAFAVKRRATNAYGAAAGLLAMSAFGLNLLSPRLATLVRTDMALALVVFLLGAKIWSKVREQAPWTSRDRLVMFAFLTAAMLIKGPIIYAFLLPGILAFQWVRRNPENAGSAWCGWSPWVASLAIFLGWVALGIATMPGFYEQVVLKEFAGRFSETVHRPQPFYFYLPHLLHKFAPWSLLLLTIGLMDRRERKIPPDVAWLICWSIGGLLVMSLVPSKRVDRIFPVLPPLCLLVAAFYATATANEKLSRRVNLWSGIALIAACILATGYAAQKVTHGYRNGAANLVDFGAAVRREAAEKNWRYEVIGGKDEGLLLYLRRSRFLREREAIERWEAGNLDAVVVPAEHAGEMSALLGGAVERERDARGEYVLLRK